MLFPTVSSYLLNAFALRAVPATLVAIYVYVQPVAGTLLAWLWLNERLAPATALAALLIFAGIWLVSRDAHRARAASRR